MERLQKDYNNVLSLQTSSCESKEKKTKQKEKRTILKVCKDVMGYMMFNFLKPVDISSCYVAHKCFWALTKKQYMLVMKSKHLSFLGTIEPYDHDLFEYFFRIHNLEKQNSICYRGDMMLMHSVECGNIKVFKRILQQPTLNLTNVQISNILYECGPSYKNYNGDMQFLFIDWCIEKGIDIEKLICDEKNGFIDKKILPEILKKLVEYNCVERVQKLKNVYKIDVPRKFIIYTNNTKMIDYLRLYGI